MRRKTSKITVVLVSFIILMALPVVVISAPAQAQQINQDDIFVVRDVGVDETAASARAAREQALVNGQISATRQILARLTRQESRSLLPPINIEVARTLVKSLQIENEKTSNVRYLADLVVAFEPEAVRNYLRAAGVPFSEVRSRPVLVIPVLVTGGAYVLWEEPNPWRDAWRNQPASTGLVPVVSPIGDLSDLTGLSAEQAVDSDVRALGDAVARYRAGSAMVSIATITGTAPGAQTIEVIATRTGRFEEAPLLLTLQSASEEAQNVFLERAASAVIGALDDDWKLTNTVNFGAAGRILSAVPISGLASWVEVQRRLRQVPSVSGVHVLALTSDSAEIEIDFRGDAQQLVRALDRFDLILEPSGFDDQAGNLTTVLGEPTLPTHVLRLAGN